MKIDKDIRDKLAAAVVEALGVEFVGSIAFHVPPRGRVKVVMEQMTEIRSTGTSSWSVDEPKLRAVESAK